jgi:hypothetical protein
MKAVLVDVPQDLLAQRRITGADRWDEMWDGVLHMGPTPNCTHQDFGGALESWLRVHWVPASAGKVYHEINVASEGGWPHNYRVPNLILLMPKRFSIDRNEFFEGAPSAVVEIRSPNDESYEKLAFYAAIGVPEVWIMDRDTKHPELHELAAGEYRLRPSVDGWLGSSLGVQFQSPSMGKLLIRLTDRIASQSFLPDNE